MVAIRKSALQVLALGLLTSGLALAQPTAHLLCTVTSTPSTSRAESKAELMGDINYACVSSDTNLSGPDSFVDVNMLVELDVPVTNNIDFGEGDDITDAVLIVNDNNCTQPEDLGNQSNASCDTSAYQAVQYGEILNDGSTIAWNGVRLPFPGEVNPTTGDVNPSITRVRINSMRGNAASLGLPVSGTFEINAILDSQPPSNMELTRFSVVVARTRIGLIQEGVDAVSGLQCIDPYDADDDTASITFSEGFASAFKTIGVASFVDGTKFWESGYYAPDNDQNNNAGASNATQFAVTFTDIPEGVTVNVDITYNLGTLQLTQLGNSCGTGGSTNLDSDDLNGDGYVIVGFNVCQTNPLAVEEAMLDFDIDWDPANPPAVGVGTVGVSFWPLDGSDVASGPDDEPRFVDTSEPANFLNVEKCVTTLLWPFVTNQSGFDTGLVVSNTSDDWGLSNADPQDGDCEVHYLGTDTNGVMPADDVTTSEVVAGDQLIWLLSSGGTHGLVGAPDFQGYVFAACEFQYAHGYAFITDGFGGGIPALAQGYLALIVPADRTIDNTVGESLGN